jgi:hypothetical protein
MDQGKPDRYQKPVRPVPTLGWISFSFNYNDLLCFGYLAGLFFGRHDMALTLRLLEISNVELQAKIERLVQGTALHS